MRWRRSRRRPGHGSQARSPRPPRAQRGASQEAVAAGQHALEVATTGTGKTLAAFLWAPDRLTRFPAEAIGESGIAFSAPPVVARAHHGSMSREQAIR